MFKMPKSRAMPEMPFNHSPKRKFSADVARKPRVNSVKNKLRQIYQDKPETESNILNSIRLSSAQLEQRMSMNYIRKMEQQKLNVQASHSRTQLASVYSPPAISASQL